MNMVNLKAITNKKKEQCELTNSKDTIELYN